MNVREVIILSWMPDPKEPMKLQLGIINNTQRYVGNIAVGSKFVIDRVLENYENTASYLGQIALDEPSNPRSLNARLFLSRNEGAGSFGTIEYKEANPLIAQLDTLERLVNKDDDLF